MRLKALAAILSAAAIILLAVRQRSTTPPPRALVKSESKASEVARTRDAEARAADADHVAQEAKGDAERREELNQALRARAQAADAAASAAEAREQASNARAAAAERRAARAEAALRAAKPVAAAGAPARGLTLPRLDPQRMVASWAEAQELLGLNRTAAENIELVLGFYNMSRGCGHHRHVRYVMMSKVASEDISGNMRAWAHGERTDPTNCTFTFVREPLKKFISGAVEMEWRFRQRAVPLLVQLIIHPEKPLECPSSLTFRGHREINPRVQSHWVRACFVRIIGQLKKLWHSQANALQLSKICVHAPNIADKVVVIPRKGSMDGQNMSQCRPICEGPRHIRRLWAVPRQA